MQQPLWQWQILLHWPKDRRVSTAVDAAPVLMKLRSADMRSCTEWGPRLSPYTLVWISPGSRRLLWACLGFLTHLWENIPEKSCFSLTGHVSGYRSIKICDMDEWEWPDLWLAGTLWEALVIIIALVWVSGLQPRGEMWVLKMKASFSCRKYSNTSCFLTVLQFVWFLPCHPIWVRIMHQAREKGKPVWSWKSIAGVTTHSMIPTFIFWEQRRAGSSKALQTFCHWLHSMHVSYSWTSAL